jgi:hypothetical protein
MKHLAAAAAGIEMLLSVPKCQPGQPDLYICTARPNRNAGGGLLLTRGFDNKCESAAVINVNDLCICLLT